MPINSTADKTSNMTIVAVTSGATAKKEDTFNAIHSPLPIQRLGSAQQFAAILSGAVDNFMVMRLMNPFLHHH